MFMLLKIYSSWGKWSQKIQLGELFKLMLLQAAVATTSSNKRVNTNYCNPAFYGGAECGSWIFLISLWCKYYLPFFTEIFLTFLEKKVPTPKRNYGSKIEKPLTDKTSWKTETAARRSRTKNQACSKDLYLLHCNTQSSHVLCKFR